MCLYWSRSFGECGVYQLSTEEYLKRFVISHMPGDTLKLNVLFSLSGFQLPF